MRQPLPGPPFPSPASLVQTEAGALSFLGSLLYTGRFTARCLVFRSSSPKAAAANLVFQNRILQANVSNSSHPSCLMYMSLRSIALLSLVPRPPQAKLQTHSTKVLVYYPKPAQEEHMCPLTKTGSSQRQEPCPCVIISLHPAL